MVVYYTEYIAYQIYSNNRYHRITMLVCFTVVPVAPIKIFAFFSTEQKKDRKRERQKKLFASSPYATVTQRYRKKEKVCFYHSHNLKCITYCCAYRSIVIENTFFCCYSISAKYCIFLMPV
jgi:hypothetical protein